MAEGSKGRLFDLPETKGTFQLKGIVTGMLKDNAYKEIRTKNGKDMRIVNFGVKYNEEGTSYVNIQGMERDNVYFYKRPEEKGGKGSTAKIPWADRLTFNRDGYRLIGVNVGVTKKIDTKGRQVNDSKMMTEFDACRKIMDNLQDDDSVYIRGNINYGSFTTNSGEKRTSIKLEPNQISLCAPVDFKAENYEEAHDFQQLIVFMGIEQELGDDNRPTGRYVVSAKIVTYSTIEDVQFIVENKKLANTLKKNLRPYNAINVHGHMAARSIVDTVEETDEWGESNPMTRQGSPVVREFIISGADGSSIDREVYSEDKINAAIMRINSANKAVAAFGDDDATDTWGSSASFDNSSDEEDVW